MKLYARIIFLISLVVWQAANLASAQPQTVYIGDNLRVGVRAAPDSQAAPFSVVLTGMKLEVLEQAKGYLKIRTAKGETGWIKDIYVTDAPPAMIRLKALQKHQNQLQSELTALEETINVLEAANRALNEQVDALKQERSQLQLEKARHDYLQQAEENSRLWWWLMLAALLLAAAAFSSGIIWHRQQAMKRLGGLRV